MASFTSVKSGDWNDPTVWGNLAGGEYPAKTTDDDTVTIGSNHTVNYNIDNSSVGTNHRIRSILVGGGETLTFDTTMSTHLWIGGSTTDSIECASGTVSCGSSGSPLSSAYTMTIEVDQSIDGTGRIIDLSNNGIVKLYGTAKTIKKYTTTALTANTDTSLTFDAVPSDWAVGDQLLIQSTVNNNNLEYDEVITIASKTGTTVSFSDGAGTGGAVAYDHLSGCIVLNLTRNIRFIAKDTSSRCREGIYQGTSAEEVVLENVEFNGCTNGDRGGAWCIATQDAATRYIRLTGCVTYNQGNDGAAAPGSGSITHKDCIFAYNTGQAFDSGNDTGKAIFENCYFVHNGSYGIRGARGQVIAIDCQFWTNNTAFYVSGETRMYNCRIFGNNDTGFTSTGGAHLYGCYFGESECGTQSNYNASKTENTPAYFHDCYFASGEDFQNQNNAGINAYSSNHNQTANNFITHYTTSGMSMVDDTTTFRTTSPSVQMIPGDVGRHCFYEIPMQVESGTSYTVTIYGKKNATGAWKDPEARIIGCGLSDSAIWSTADTNWNAITLSGTASRDGVAIITIITYGETFNIDDVTVV